MSENPKAPKQTYPRVISLSDGRKCEITRKYKGRDYAKATLVVGKETENLPAAVCARVIKIDGKDVVMEDLLDMDGDDYITIIAEAMGND